MAARGIGCSSPEEEDAQLKMKWKARQENYYKDAGSEKRSQATLCP